MGGSVGELVDASGGLGRKHEVGGIRTCIDIVT